MVVILVSIYRCSTVMTRGETAMNWLTNAAVMAESSSNYLPLSRCVKQNFPTEYSEAGTDWEAGSCSIVCQEDQPEWWPLQSLGHHWPRRPRGWTSGKPWTGRCGGLHSRISPSRESPPFHSFLPRWLLLRCCLLQSDQQSKTQHHINTSQLMPKQCW